MRAISRAAALLAATSSPIRLSILAAVALRESRGDDHSLEAVAADTGLSVRTLVDEACRLRESGLLSIVGHRLSTDLSVLQGTAEELVAALPVSVLLREEPALKAFFKHGRLSRLPESPDTLSKCLHVIARLLPVDRKLSEAEVNAILLEVSDDYASLRRLLVDHGLVTRSRDGGSYQRVPDLP